MHSPMGCLGRSKPCVCCYLCRHGFINFGVAPLLLNEPLANRGDRKSIIVIGAGLAGVCVCVLSTVVSRRSASGARAPACVGW